MGELLVSSEPIKFIPVAEALGHKLTDDGQYVLLGFRHPEGPEIAIGIKPGQLNELIASMIAAKSLSPVPRIGAAEDFAMTVERFDVGETPVTGEIFLRLRFPSKGHIGLGLDRSLALQLIEHLQVATGTAVPTADGTKN